MGRYFFRCWCWFFRSRFRLCSPFWLSLYLNRNCFYRFFVLGFLWDWRFWWRRWFLWSFCWRFFWNWWFLWSRNLSRGWNFWCRGHRRFFWGCWGLLCCLRLFWNTFWWVYFRFWIGSMFFLGRILIICFLFSFFLIWDIKIYR